MSPTRYPDGSHRMESLPDGLPDAMRHVVDDGTEGVGLYDGFRREESIPGQVFPRGPVVTYEWIEHNAGRCAELAAQATTTDR